MGFTQEKKMNTDVCDFVRGVKNIVSSVLMSIMMKMKKGWLAQP